MKYWYFILSFFKNYFYLLDKVIYYINIYFSLDNTNQLIINKLYYIFDSGNYLYESKKINYSIKQSNEILDKYLEKLDLYNVIDADKR